MSGPRFTRYRSADEDSGRWEDFQFRDGDIVISTRSKSGTTWMQMICAQLIFQGAPLPAKLSRLSPWVDSITASEQDLFAGLDTQDHRRFVKTHTPLDGVPLVDRATYIVVARHPLDMAVSLYHQGANIDRVRMSELTGTPVTPTRVRPSAHDWVKEWVAEDLPPEQSMDGLRGVLWHLSGAWALREGPNIVLVHYDDLQADLPGQMRRLAERLRIEVEPQRWPQLVRAAGFAAMKANAANLAPGQDGVFKDPGAFFRRGSSGAGRELLDARELAEYERRAAELAPPALLDWLHRPRPAV